MMCRNVIRLYAEAHGPPRPQFIQNRATKRRREEPDGAERGIDDLHDLRRVWSATAGTEKVERDVDSGGGADAYACDEHLDPGAVVTDLGEIEYSHSIEVLGVVRLQLHGIDEMRFFLSQGTFGGGSSKYHIELTAGLTCTMQYTALRPVCTSSTSSLDNIMGRNQ
ncbi:hypothetical protein IAQ61_005558 [Plenodomus lingam]|uniref:uncharacterized protein n=1 Tax=Leptosphaeria maculans TaxID=5022 RepID=UPI00332EBBF1|nr:hypothetical protein IAQ61_005558 [Plenodomus lingam]